MFRSCNDMSYQIIALVEGFLIKTETYEGLN